MNDFPLPYSSFSRFFMPARSGLLQVIVADEQQAQAASIGQATFALAIVFGPALASPLYFAVGPVVACIINAASFLVSAACILAIRVSKKALHPYVKSDTSGVNTVMKELFAGYRLVLTTRMLFMVLILALIAMLGAGALNALDIIFVSQRLHVSTSLYGPLTGVGGLGVLVGAILAGIVASRVKPSTMLNVSVFLLGLGIIIYAFQTAFVPALIIYFFISIPNGGIEVSFAPLVLNATPRAMMGRVQSVIETAMFGASLVSVGLAGYLGQFMPVYIIFAISGGLIAISGVFDWFALPKETKTADTLQDTTNEPRLYHRSN